MHGGKKNGKTASSLPGNAAVSREISSMEQKKKRRKKAGKKKRERKFKEVLKLIKHSTRNTDAKINEKKSLIFVRSRLIKPKHCHRPYQLTVSAELCNTIRINASAVF